MAIVTNVEMTKTHAKIDLDGRFFARLQMKYFKKMPIEINEAIDEDDYIDHIAQLQLKDAYETALTSLDFSARTAVELRRRLKQKGFVEPAVDAVVQRLKSNGLINDEQYAERMVEIGQQKQLGLYALKRKMRSKGLDEDLVDSALEEIDPEDQLQAAKEAASKLSRRYASEDDRTARRKLGQALARRGFSWDIIESALADLSDE